MLILGNSESGWECASGRCNLPTSNSLLYLLYGSAWPSIVTTDCGFAIIGRSGLSCMQPAAKFWLIWLCCLLCRFVSYWATASCFLFVAFTVCLRAEPFGLSCHFAVVEPSALVPLWSSQPRYRSPNMGDGISDVSLVCWSACLVVLVSSQPPIWPIYFVGFKSRYVQLILIAQSPNPLHCFLSADAHCFGFIYPSHYQPLCGVFWCTISSSKLSSFINFQYGQCNR